MVMPDGHDEFDSVAQTLLAVSFSDPCAAEEFMVESGRLALAGVMSIRDSVVVARDGRAGMPARGSSVPAAVWAGLIGLLLGDRDDVHGHVHLDLGIPDDWLGWFRDAVRSATATVVMLVDDLDAEPFLDELQRFSGATLVYAHLGTPPFERLAGALHQGRLLAHAGIR